MHPPASTIQTEAGPIQNTSFIQPAESFVREKSAEDNQLVHVSQTLTPWNPRWTNNGTSKLLFP